MRHMIVGCLLCIMGLIIAGPAWSGSLDKVRKTTKSDHSNDDDDKKDNTHSFCLFFCHDDHDTHDRYNRHEQETAAPSPPSCPATSSYYLPYPYAHKRPGRSVIVENDLLQSTPPVLDTQGRVVQNAQYFCPEKTPKPNKTYNSAGNLFLGYTYDLEGVHMPEFDLSGDFGTATFRTGWIYLLEKDGDSSNRLILGDLNGLVRLQKSSTLEVRFGIGLRFLVDWHNLNAEIGYTGILSLNAFPHKPWVISADLDVGSLGSALFVHTRETLGLILGPVELFAGYNLMLILGNGNKELLHGPFGGIRFWF